MSTSMSEVQSHGFSWQNEILKIYGATQEELDGIGYTDAEDLPAAFNRLDGISLSIKTAGNKNAICMADCLRVFDMITGPIRMVVIRYIQKKDIKQISRIIEVDLSNSRDLLFGTLTREQIETLDKAVKSVPQKRKPSQEEHKHMYDIKKQLQKISGAMSLNIKCNSTQSRLQCSIPFKKFELLIKNNPSRVIAQSNTNEFRGGTISHEIQSCCRKFKPK